MKTLWIDGGVESGRVNETAGDSSSLSLPSSSPLPPSLDRLEPFEREQLRLLDEVMARERACLRIVEFYIDRARCCLLLLLLFLLPHIFFHVMMEQGDGAKLDTRND